MTHQELLNRLDDLSFEFISIEQYELNFVRPANFNRHQLGYREGLNGTSLMGAHQGSWKVSWYTIGWSDLDDPIFIDLFDGCIYSSVNDENKWEPKLIAKSYDSYEAIIVELKRLSHGRETPMEFENKPISDKDLQYFQNLIEGEKANLHYWLGFVDVALTVVI